MKILIVEDEKLLADSLKGLLEQKGFSVECVYDGEDGAQYAVAGMYDLLILDVMMPRMNGYQVAREVRRCHCGIPILMLTARSELEDRIQGLNAGADYLRFCRVTTPRGRIIVFSDITSERTTLRNLAETCVMIGSVCFFAFLAISIFLARWMVRPVDKAWRQQRQFVSDASHELKTPLAVIMTNAELLQSPDTDEASRRRSSDSILVMSRQMRSLVERLLELARVESEPKSAEHGPLDLSHLTEKALLPFEPLFFEKGLTLESRVQREITVCGSEQQLSQVVGILLDNALKYADPTGAVEVRLEQGRARRCRLTVSNPGRDMTSEELKALFTRFYRGDATRRRDGGFGLGLSIAESIVRQHRGRIWAESREGRIVFLMELPTQ